MESEYGAMWKANLQMLLVRMCIVGQLKVSSRHVNQLQFQFYETSVDHGPRIHETIL